MAISFVASGTVQTGANSTVDVPTGYAAGDALLIITTGTATPSLPTNWTSVYSQGSLRFLTVYLKIATASEASVTLTQAGTTSKAVMLAYRGTSYFDVIGTIATGTSTAPATSSLTTSWANDYVISLYADSFTAATWTAPASTTSRVNSASTASVNGLLIVDELKTAAGATTIRTATLSTSVAWSAIAISFKEPQSFYIDPENGADANNGRTFATALKNISGATAAKLITGGDTIRIKQSPLYNTGVNATWTSVQQRGVSSFSSQSIIGATNAAPIVISTSLAHGYSTGDVVQIIQANGNTAANGIFKVTVVNSTSFSMDDSSGNGAWTSGGIINPIFCRTIKTATPLVKPVASFAPLKTVSLGVRAAWVGATGNITTAITATMGKGASYDTITINASATTGLMAYYTLPATLNLSGYQQLSLFISQTSGTLGGLTISFCSDTLGATAVNTFTIPSTGALSIWCPFTFDNGSALGSSIKSISISRAVNNGAQTFNFNSIVACTAPTAVDALSNTSLVTKNNGTETACAVGGFGGSDGSIVFLENNPTTFESVITSGAYYGTTETVALYRIQPFNPWTLNSLTLPASAAAATASTVFTTNSGILNANITYSGGWDSTNMSTLTGQTCFDTQNGYGSGLNLTATPNYITIDKVNYSRAYYGFYFSSASIGIILQNCNYTAIVQYGIYIGSSAARINIQNCIVSNVVSDAIYFQYGSNDITTPMVINNCVVFGGGGYGLSIANSNAYPYYTITNNSFNTITSGLNIVNEIYTTLTNNSVNYFGTYGFFIQSNILGTINNLTFVPNPKGANTIIVAVSGATYEILPQNIYSTWNNITVTAPTTAYSQGTTTLILCIQGGFNCKFINGIFTPSNVTYTLGNNLYECGGAYLYNCTGVPSVITPSTQILPPYINNAAFYSQDEGNTVGNNKIYFSGGLGTSQTTVRHTPSGYAWSLAPTSTTTVTSTYPLKLKLGSIAANSGSAVTISAYMQRTDTGLTMQLVCPANQPYGPSTDTISSMTVAANTWEQVSISFTPTQNGVFDIYAYAYGGTTFTGYIDDLGVSQ